MDRIHTLKVPQEQTPLIILVTFGLHIRQTAYWVPWIKTIYFICGQEIGLCESIHHGPLRSTD